MACSRDINENVAKAEALVIRAAETGGQVILLQELFETPYFCLEQSTDHLPLARPLEQSQVVQHFSALARKLGVVLPTSYYEEAAPRGP